MIWPLKKVIPSGILIPKIGELTLTLGQSAKTSDFVADALEKWWQETSPRFALTRPAPSTGGREKSKFPSVS